MYIGIEIEKNMANRNNCSLKQTWYPFIHDSFCHKLEYVQNLGILTNVRKKNSSMDTEEKMRGYGNEETGQGTQQKWKFSSYNLTCATSIFFLFDI